MSPDVNSKRIEKIKQTKRSPELQRAWADQKMLQEEFLNGKSLANIAAERGINVRSAYRIVRGK